MPALRDAFLALSTNPAAHKAIVGFPLSRKFTRRFVAGETLADAVHAVQQLNEQGLAATLDHLGESVTNADQARRAKDAYLAALDAIAQHRLRSHVQSSSRIWAWILTRRCVWIISNRLRQRRRASAPRCALTWR